MEKEKDQEKKEEEIQEVNSEEVTEDIPEEDKPEKGTTAVVNKIDSGTSVRLTTHRKEQYDILGDKQMFTEQALNDAQKLIDSKLLPDSITKPEQVLVIIQTGKELGFSMMTSFQYVMVINGKPGLMGKALMRKLREGQIEWKTLHDYETLYSVGDKVGFAEELLEQGININDYELKGDKKFIGEHQLRVLDGVTSIRFRRPSKLEESGYVEEIGRFTYKEAVLASLVTKPVWKNYLRLMLWWRAFSVGANRIGSDLTLGLSTIEEIDDSGTIYMDGQGNMKKL